MVLVVILLAASSVFAYEYLLSTEDIRTAYFIGNRGDVTTAEFLEQYTRRFPAPDNGPRIGMIQLLTPYAQVVERAEQALNYYPPDAVQEFLGKPGDFRLRVQIFFTPTYSAVVKVKGGKITGRAASFWKDFNITLIQGVEIHAMHVTEHPIYSNGEHSRWEGSEVELDYSAATIRSEPVQVKVLGPEASDTRASFDLAKLR